jgi:hypothetical protein
VYLFDIEASFLPRTECSGLGRLKSYVDNIWMDACCTGTEDRGQRTEDRGQRTEDRGQRTEDRGEIVGNMEGAC